jgi:5-methyltetrahydrofolate--homocysteine methyltransferase
LVLSKPNIIKEIHSSFLEVGCQVIETDTFGANKVVSQDYNLAEKTYQINKRAAEIAKEVANDFSSSNFPRFVSGSVGPGNKLPTLEQIDFDTLTKSYQIQIEGLIDGNVDMIQIETAQDLLQIKAALFATFKVFQKKKLKIPIIVQVTMAENGKMLVGSDMLTALTVLEPYDIDVIGLNCGTGPKSMKEHVRILSHYSPKYISVIPNAGLPENINGKIVYKLSSEEFSDTLAHYVKDFGVNIVGGCCGTTPNHLKALVDAVKDISPLKRSPQLEPSATSLYDIQNFSVSPKPLIIGERTNANGSKRFREFLKNEDWDKMVEIALDQQREGAHLLDVSTAYVGRDEKTDMSRLIFRLNKEIEIPLMIDTIDVSVMEEALKRISGKAIINSVNFEDGVDKVKTVISLCKDFGAALVCLAIDEDGMAFSVEKKIEIARRFYNLAINCGMNPSNLFFDTLTFSLGTRDEQYFNAAKNSLAAIHRIKIGIPEMFTILGISNVSYGLNTGLRKVLNSVFFHYAIESGLDAAILHAGNIISLHEISQNERKLCNELIFNNRKPDYDPLKGLIELFTEKWGKEKKKREIRTLCIEELLPNQIINGTKYNLEKTLDEALKKYKPIEIINHFLLKGMEKVGKLFDSGEMQLPFVLKSSEVMKTAVGYLEKYMPKIEMKYKGSIILATVKGDVHDIGKNLAGVILSNNGIKVIDLGVKQTADNIIQAIRKFNPDCVGLSGLLVKSTMIMKEDLEIFNEENISIPVICGGAALFKQYVKTQLNTLYKGDVYYAADAFDGLRIMQNLIKEKGLSKLRQKLNTSISNAKEVREKVPEEKIRVYSRPFAVSKSTLTQATIPSPPFWGTKIIKNIPLSRIFPYINKKSLYFKQWQLKMKPDNQETCIWEFSLPRWIQIPKSKFLGQNVIQRGDSILKKMKSQAIAESIIQPKVVYGYFPCLATEDSLIIFYPKSDKVRLEFYFPRQKNEPYLSITDYFQPKADEPLAHRKYGSQEKDVVAIMLVTIGKEASEKSKELLENDSYENYLYWHGFSVVMAEALAEYWHKEIRKELQIDKADSREIVRQLPVRRPDNPRFNRGGMEGGADRKEYQGARYSLGYPSCPDIEQQRKIFMLLKPERIGVTLSETFQLIPEQSISAFIVHHPQARYFSV